VPRNLYVATIEAGSRKSLVVLDPDARQLAEIAIQARSVRSGA
jgi:hypothetical protein